MERRPPFSGLIAVCLGEQRQLVHFRLVLGPERFGFLEKLGFLGVWLGGGISNGFFFIGLFLKFGDWGERGPGVMGKMFLGKKPSGEGFLLKGVQREVDIFGRN